MAAPASAAPAKGKFPSTRTHWADEESWPGETEGKSISTRSFHVITTHGLSLFIFVPSCSCLEFYLACSFACPLTILLACPCLFACLLSCLLAVSTGGKREIEEAEKNYENCKIERSIDLQYLLVRPTFYCIHSLLCWTLYRKELYSNLGMSHKSMNKNNRQPCNRPTIHPPTHQRAIYLTDLQNNL